MNADLHDPLLLKLVQEDFAEICSLRARRVRQQIQHPPLPNKNQPSESSSCARPTGGGAALPLSETRGSCPMAIFMLRLSLVMVWEEDVLSEAKRGRATVGVDSFYNVGVATRESQFPVAGLGLPSCVSSTLFPGLNFFVATKVHFSCLNSTYVDRLSRRAGACCSGPAVPRLRPCGCLVRVVGAC